MGATPTSRYAVTGDELREHRLRELEEWRVESAATIRSTERDVDLLKLESGTIKGLLVELRTEVRERDEHMRQSLARFHDRLDEGLKGQQDQINAFSREDAFEQGRDAGAKDSQTKTGKVVAVTLTLVIAFGALVVGVLTLILN
jgi:hypothetical protein